MTLETRRIAAVASAIALGLGVTAPAEAPADPGPEWRLAATVQGAEAGMALIASGERQAWLRPGDQLGACVLRGVESAAAVLACDGRITRLLLEPGVADAPANARPDAPVELPPGTIEALAARPQALALGLELVPEVDGGALRGWRIVLLDASNPLFPLGLRENDLVLAVAGFPAAEPRSLVSGLRSLPQHGSFNITVQRDDQVVDLAIITAAAPAVR